MNIIKKYILVAIAPLLFSGCFFGLFDNRVDFKSNMSNLSDDIAYDLESYVTDEEVILVSDFVNIDNPDNKSSLGFVLSGMMKNELSIKTGLKIKEIELSKQFKLGKSGFKLLTREQSEISQKAIKAKYAVIGSYAFTTTQVIVFARLINIVDGTIRSSNTISFPISDELKRLEGIHEKKNVLEIY